MTDITFVKTKYQDIGYHSYADFWRLVELSGYPVCYVNEIDPDDPTKVYIVTPLNDEWLEGWPGAKARIIHYELEWRTDWRAEVNEPPGIAEVWAGDRAYATRIGAKYVPLGSHPGLNLLPMNERRVFYDVAFMGYRQPYRRARKLAEFSEAGLTIAPDDWGIRRSELLMQSGCMAIIHQWDNAAGIAPLRMCIAAAHKLPVISEAVPDSGVFSSTFMMQCNYSTLPYFIRDRVRDRWKNQFEDHGFALYDYLCKDWTFKKSIEGAL